MSSLPTPPPVFKPIIHYLKTASDHEQRDIAVAYYCRMYALQKGMEIDRKSPEAKSYLGFLMGHLEQLKSTHKDNESIHNEVVGQAHIENYSYKLFLFADNEDRASHFTKPVIKSFYTAGMLFDVLETFGPVSEEVEKNRKYAKWKAAYINSCLKNGETPQPGPLNDDDGPSIIVPNGGNVNSDMPSTSQQQYQPPVQPSNPPPVQPPPPQWQQAPPPAQPQASYSPAPPPAAGAQLSSAQFERATKLSKHATSALQYQDSKTAIELLQKCMNLLTTGHE